MATARKTPEVTIETITPARAQKDLVHRAPNRAISSPTVSQYATDMTAGKFVLNGESIIYDREGRLLDGEHRMTACVKSGKSFTSVVVYGIEPEAHPTIDIGRKRTVGDTLRIHGCTYYVYVSGGMRWLKLMALGQFNSTGDVRVTPEEALVTWLSDRPRMDAAAYAGKLVARILSPSMATACHYRFSELDRDQADRFFGDLASGADLALDDPVLVLRRRLLANRSDRRKTLGSPEVLALVIRAWNLRRRGKTTKLLRGTIQTDKGAIPAPL